MDQLGLILVFVFLALLLNDTRVSINKEKHVSPKDDRDETERFYD